MGKTAAILAACLVPALGLLAHFSRSSDNNPPVSRQPVETEASAGFAESGAQLPAEQPSIETPAQDGSSLTKEEFEKLPKEDQDKAVEAFVARFWASESGAAPTTGS